MHHEVGLGDGPGLVIEFLAVDLDEGLRVELLDAVHGDHEHAAGAGRRIVDGTHRHLVLGKVAGGLTPDEKIGDQTNHFTRGVVLTGGLVTHLGELPQQFLEDVTHGLVADLAGTQVQVREVGHDAVQDPGVVHPGDLPVELVRLDHRRRVRGEGRDVLGEVVSQVLVVTEQPGECVPRRVIEPLAADTLEHPVLTRANLHQTIGVLQDLILGGLQHRIHTAQHQQRQHHRAVLMLLERTA